MALFDVFLQYGLSYDEKNDIFQGQTKTNYSKVTEKYFDIPKEYVT